MHGGARFANVAEPLVNVRAGRELSGTARRSSLLAASRRAVHRAAAASGSSPARGCGWNVCVAIPIRLLPSGVRGVGVCTVPPEAGAMRRFRPSSGRRRDRRLRGRAEQVPRGGGRRVRLHRLAEVRLVARAHGTAQPRCLRRGHPRSGSDALHLDRHRCRGRGRRGDGLRSAAARRRRAAASPVRAPGLGGDPRSVLRVVRAPGVRRARPGTSAPTSW